MIIRIRVDKRLPLVSDRPNFPSFVMLTATPEGDLAAVFEADGESVTVPIEDVSTWDYMEE